MILHPSTPPDTGHAALREHLERDLHLNLGGDAAARGDIPDIAAALATAWAIDFQRATLPSLVYPILASRILYNLGRREAAERLLRSRMRTDDHADAMLRVLERGGPSLGGCTLVADGILRPAVSSLCRRGSAWVVDMDRLAGPVDPVLELQLLGRLRRALEVAADLFESDRGTGLVLLAGVKAPGKGASAAAGMRPGWPGGRELCLFAQDVVNRLARDRGWPEAPRVHVQARGRPLN